MSLKRDPTWRSITPHTFEILNSQEKFALLIAVDPLKSRLLEFELIARGHMSSNPTLDAELSLIEVDYRGLKNLQHFGSRLLV